MAICSNFVVRRQPKTNSLHSCTHTHTPQRNNIMRFAIASGGCRTCFALLGERATENTTGQQPAARCANADRTRLPAQSHTQTSYTHPKYDAIRADAAHTRHSDRAYARGLPRFDCCCCCVLSCTLTPRHRAAVRLYTICACRLCTRLAHISY